MCSSDLGSDDVFRGVDDLESPAGVESPYGPCGRGFATGRGYTPGSGLATGGNEFHDGPGGPIDDDSPRRPVRVDTGTEVDGQRIAQPDAV